MRKKATRLQHTLPLSRRILHSEKPTTKAGLISLQRETNPRGLELGNTFSTLKLVVCNCAQGLGRCTAQSDGLGSGCWIARFHRELPDRVALAESNPLQDNCNELSYD